MCQIVGHSASGGPGRYFTDHRALYGISVAGAAGAALSATWRATHANRIAWVALAVLEAAITAGVISERTPGAAH